MSDMLVQQSPLSPLSYIEVTIWRRLFPSKDMVHERPRIRIVMKEACFPIRYTAVWCSRKYHQIHRS